MSGEIATEELNKAKKLWICNLQKTFSLSVEFNKMRESLGVFKHGVRETLLEIRSKYWIPKGRQTVKRILNKCLLCRKLEGLPYPSPTVSDLPEFRVVGG